MTATVRSPRRLVTLSAATTVAVALLGVGSALVVLPEPEPAPPPSALALALALARVGLAGPPPGAAFVDDLRAPSPRWAAWVQGAPESASATPGRGGLELSLDTRGSSPGLVHGVGVLSSAIPIGAAGCRVEARLDWRAPPNACYRAAGLCVVAADAGVPEPMALEALRPAAWLEVAGVPPGRAARRFAAVRLGPHPDPVFTDGWPVERAGRAVERTVLGLDVWPDRVALHVDGVEVGCAAAPLGGAIRIVLFLTSHANYPARPVVFEHVSVRPLDPRAVEVVASARGSRP